MKHWLVGLAAVLAWGCGKPPSPSAAGDIDRVDRYGRTQLWYAALQGDEHKTESLLMAGADPNISDQTGSSPLAMAVQAGNVGAAKALIRHKADLNAVTGDGTTLLGLAGSFKGKDCMLLLVQSGVDPTKTPPGSWSVMHFAAMWDDVALCEAAVKAGASVETLDDGTRPLWTAARMSPKVTKYLLEHGADPNAPNGASRRSALFQGVFGGRETVRLLLAHGARADARDANGRSVLDYYRANSKQEGKKPDAEVIALLSRQ